MIEEAFIGAVQVHGGDNGIGVNSWYDRATPRQQYMKNPRAHGGRNMTTFFDGRLFSIGGLIEVDDPDDLEDVCDLLSGAMTLSDEPVLLRFKRRGKTHYERAYVTQWSELDAPRELADGEFLARWSVDLYAEDPRVYSDVETEGAYDPTQLGGDGLSFPLVFPLDFGNTNPVYLKAINSGQFPTPPTYTVYGPIGVIGGDTAWEIADVDTGKSIYITQALVAGDVLVVDVASKLVSLNGSDPRPDLVDASRTRWTELASGLNRLRLLGSGMSAGSTELAVSFRSARI